MRKTLSIVLFVLLSIIAVVLLSLEPNHTRDVADTATDQKLNMVSSAWLNPIVAAPLSGTSLPSMPTADFVSVAEKAMPAAVHIKTKIYTRTPGNSGGNSGNNFWNYDFFGGDNNSKPPQQKDFASGSGVIISPDGYIITNHHVLEDADEIEVILNDKRAFKAQISGSDRSTDLAILKINASGLPSLVFGNSDNVRVGEWVMAVGNPFRLSSTVTTGVVSAKGRNIDILEDKLAIESFIQTDAAVNPGNSGGALVNLKGELIGINTAIATPTGYYAGYSFAVPSNIAQKVTADIIREGSVRRGFLGVSVRDIDQELALQLNLNRLQGVYVAKVSPQGGAYEAGIAAGDIITHIGSIPVNSPPELQEVIGRFHPNDVVNIIVLRQNTTLQIQVVLKEGF